MMDVVHGKQPRSSLKNPCLHSNAHPSVQSNEPSGTASHGTQTRSRSAKHSSTYVPGAHACSEHGTQTDPLRKKPWLQLNWHALPHVNGPPRGGFAHGRQMASLVELHPDEKKPGRQVMTLQSTHACMIHPSPRAHLYSTVRHLRFPSAGTQHRPAKERSESHGAHAHHAERRHDRFAWIVDRRGHAGWRCRQWQARGRVPSIPLHTSKIASAARPHHRPCDVRARTALRIAQAGAV